MSAEPIPSNDPQVLPSGETLLDAIKRLLADDKFQEKLATTLRVKKPEGVSGRSNYSYYREEFALEVKIIIDQMMEDKKDKIWLFDDFPELKPNTLYLRVQQGLYFLHNEMDFDGRYERFRKLITLEKVPGKGVALRFLKDKLNGKLFKAVDLEEDAVEPSSLMVEISKFLKNNDKKIFEKEITLSDTEVNDIETMLLPLQTVVAAITRTQIKIVKI